LREAREHDAGMRQERKHGHRRKRQQRQGGAPPAQFPRRMRDRRLGLHGIGVAAEEHAAAGVEQHAGNQHYGHQGEGERAGADLLELVIDLHCGATRVVEHQRRAKLREAGDEDQRAARKQSRHHQWQRDAAEGSPSTAAKVGGSFLHGRIDVGQRGGDVEVEDRIERQRLQHNHAEDARLAEPVHRAETEQRIQRSIGSEDLQQADRADKGWKDHGHKDERAEQAAPRKPVAVVQPCQRHGQQCREQR